MTHAFQKNFNEYLHRKFPSTGKQNLILSESLISPFILDLPRDVLDQASRVVAACFELRSNPQYAAYALAQPHDSIVDFEPGGFSLFMSYDFHLSPDGLKLIEINTNAAFSLVVHELYLYQNVQKPESLHHDFPKVLRESFGEEMRLSTGKAKPSKIAIVDDDPAAQKMFIEFVMFRDLFESWGMNTQISDIRSLDIGYPDFIYNRSTNFYLNGLEDLRKAYTAKKFCLSPNPREYFLLADKNRMIGLSDSDFLARCGLSATHIETLKRHVPFVRDLSKLSPDEVWAQRKDVFFKPKRSHGGKEVYKGANITRKVFEQILAGDFIAQQAVPAPQKLLKMEDGVDQDFKYDLRFYAYKDRIQLATARFYQGQVTNFRAPGSGFSALTFS